MSRPAAFGTGEAIAHRIDQGFGRSLNWTETIEAVQHPTEKLKRTELVEVIAYLGAQLVGSRNSIDADAALAMRQILTIAGNYKDRLEGVA